MNIEVFIYCLKPFNYIAITFEKKTTWSLFLFILSFLMGTVAHASPNTITFQSRIIKPDGTALEAAAVNFRFSITDTVGSCVIYQEDFNNRNMSGSKGLINLSMGAGSKVYPVAAMTLSEVFNNYNSPTLNCQAGGNIAAGATDRRKLIVQFSSMEFITY